MPKSKSTRKSKVTKFDTDRLPPSFFEEMIDDLENERMMHPGYEQGLGQMASSAINAAINLAKLVIENRNHNSQKMNDKDIYDIYSNSFKAIIHATTELHD